jgi:AcrR family transcriptional regulator
MEENIRTISKVDQIIEVAQRLFGMYGLEKVSMLEIASELHFSKASLYYYFPDKENIYKAVLEKEQAEFINRITEKINGISNPEKMLSEYATMRLEYFSRLLNLSRLRLEVYSDMKPVFRETTMLFKEKELGIVMDIFNLGIKKKIFRIGDKEMTASLFLDLLKGLRVSIITDRRMLVIDQEEYSRLLIRTKAFTKIFINGLKYR